MATRSSRARGGLLALCVGALVGCSGPAASVGGAGGTPQGGAGGVGGEGGAGGGAGGLGGGGGAPVPTRLRIFHTSDEHGWIIPDEVSQPGMVRGGAAFVLGHMIGEDGYDPALDLLVSSGDGWSGPAVSTWFQGAPVVEVFDAMGYRASAVGNHELDFGQDTLAARASEASFPYLAANLRHESGALPAGVTASTIVTLGELDVALIGLVGLHTSTSAPPHAMQGLVVEPPSAALDAEAAAARAAGADVVVALFHDCTFKDLLDDLVEPVDLVLGGHCHQVSHGVVQGVQTVQSGEHFHRYTLVELDVSPAVDAAPTVVEVASVEVRNVMHDAGEPPTHPPDAGVLSLVASWVEAADAELGVVLGVTGTGIVEQSWLMANWVTDSWLVAYPEVDVALLNFGALRQSILPGDIELGDLVGVLPFDNRIVVLELSGAELAAYVLELASSCPLQDGCYPAIAGMRFTTGPFALEVGGLPVDPAALYRLATTDYVYFGGGGHPLDAVAPLTLVTGVSYRDPVAAWTASLATSAADPLEAHLDPAPRNQ